MIRSARIPVVLKRICAENLIQDALLVTAHGELLGTTTSIRTVGESSLSTESLASLVADIANDYQQLGHDMSPLVEGSSTSGKSQLSSLLLELEMGLVAVAAVILAAGWRGGGCSGERAIPVELTPPPAGRRGWSYNHHTRGLDMGTYWAPKHLLESDSDSDSDTSSSDDDAGLTGRARWVKKVPDAETVTKADRRKNKQAQQAAQWNLIVTQKLTLCC